MIKAICAFSITFIVTAALGVFCVWIGGMTLFTEAAGDAALNILLCSTIASVIVTGITVDVLAKKEPTP